MFDDKHIDAAAELMAVGLKSTGVQEGLQVMLQVVALYTPLTDDVLKGVAAAYVLESASEVGGGTVCLIQANPRAFTTPTQLLYEKLVEFRDVMQGKEGK